MCITCFTRKFAQAGDEARGALLGLAGQPVVEEMAGLEERGCCQGLKYCDAL